MFRQSDCGEFYRAALTGLAERGLTYWCECSRATFARWAADHGRQWQGPGCPLRCRLRRLAEKEGRGVRVVVGEGTEAWSDLLAGDQTGETTPDGDPLARDRDGNWTYHFAVVVDDIRHGIDLVIRGRDLLDSTARQIRLAGLLGREEPPRFLHHPLITKRGGEKLSKADRDTSIRDLRAAGATPAELLGRAAAAVGLIEVARPIHPTAIAGPFR
jgi:glutamyl-Q tRNA(Asp) synthetase